MKITKTKLLKMSWEEFGGMFLKKHPLATADDCFRVLEEIRYKKTGTTISKEVADYLKEVGFSVVEKNISYKITK